MNHDVEDKIKDLSELEYEYKEIPQDLTAAQIIQLGQNAIDFYGLKNLEKLPYVKNMVED